MNIKANFATYDQQEDVIFSGSPSVIKSKKDDNLFNGEADKIFFDDEKIHLIGNASMIYERSQYPQI